MAQSYIPKLFNNALHNSYAIYRTYKIFYDYFLLSLNKFEFKYKFMRDILLRNEKWHHVIEASLVCT